MNPPPQSAYHTRMLMKLDEARADAFKLCQAEKMAEAAKRKRSLLESSSAAALKDKLYKLWDAQFDTIWLRFVYISSSKFPSAPADQGTLLMLMSVALEVRSGIFDLLAIAQRIRDAVKGPAATIGIAGLVDQTVKNIEKMEGLTTLLARLEKFVDEAKLRVLEAEALHSPTGMRRGAIVQSDAVMPSGPTSPLSPHHLLPPKIELSIMLYEERIKNYSAAEREALVVSYPPLRDLRQGLAGLYACRCDDAAAALFLADTLGQGLWRVLQNAVSREDFAPPMHAAFLAARATAWISLRELHGLDLASTARAGAAPQINRGKLGFVVEAPPSAMIYGSSSRQSSIKRAPSGENVSAQPAHPAAAAGLSVAVPSSFHSSQPPRPPSLDSQYSGSSNSSVYRSPPPLLHAASTNGLERSPRMSPISASLNVLSPEPASANSASSLSQHERGGSNNIALHMGSADFSHSVLAGVDEADTGLEQSNGPRHRHDLSAALSDFSLPPAPSPPRNGAPATLAPRESPPSQGAGGSPVPSSSAVAAASSSPRPASTPDEWTQVTNQGKSFWYNARTGQSLWNKPLGPAATEGFAARLSRLATPGEDDGSKIESPVTVTPSLPAFAAATPKMCAYSGCNKARFAGRPYCVAHLASQ
jgi:hypothetical protein